MSATEIDPSPQSPRTSMVTANGVDLYVEISGDGPALLMIAGAGGDAGTFRDVVPQLAREFTVVCYDRRGNSRSESPVGWASTCPDEQADDAADLIRSLGLAPCAVFGYSSGAVIALNLALRHPELVGVAVAHELPKIGVLAQRERLLADLQARMETARQRGGYRQTYADFMGWIRDAAPGDEIEDRIDRMLDNGEVWVTRELGVIDRWDIPAELAASRQVPIVVTVGSEGGTAFHQALLAEYDATLSALAVTLGANFARLPGGHTPFITHVVEFAPRLADLLRRAV